MPQDYINNVYDPLNPWPEARRTTRPPLEAMLRHIPASSTGINPVHSIPVQTAIQTQLAKGGKVSRAAGRTLGEGQMYYDAAVNMLRLLDSDIPESDRANALGVSIDGEFRKRLATCKRLKGKNCASKRN
jgi:hypothetical protein